MSELDYPVTHEWERLLLFLRPAELASMAFLTHRLCRPYDEVRVLVDQAVSAGKLERVGEYHVIRPVESA